LSTRDRGYGTETTLPFARLVESMGGPNFHRGALKLLRFCAIAGSSAPHRPRVNPWFFSTRTRYNFITQRLSLPKLHRICRASPCNRTTLKWLCPVVFECTMHSCRAAAPDACTTDRQHVPSIACRILAVYSRAEPSRSRLYMCSMLATCLLQKCQTAHMQMYTTYLLCADADTTHLLSSLCAPAV